MARQDGIARRPGATLSALLLSLAACSGSGGGARGPEGDGRPAAEASGIDADDEGLPPDRVKERMNLEEARRYVLGLVNRDRKAEGLPPVHWDETAAKAGQRHAEDMAARGFTAHRGTDGSVPELRYTEAGGRHMVMENAGCLADGEARELDPDPTFTAASLERVERAFMDEVPPMDGHRRNILQPSHTSLGVGLAKVAGVDDVACMAQEFVDDYGEYEELPGRVAVGTEVEIKGRVREPAKVVGVGISRFDLPRPEEPKELLKTLSYQIPKTYALHFPRGFKSAKPPLEVRGDDFSVRVPLSDRGRKGIYGVSVWAVFPPSEELKMISLRTVRVE